LKIEQWEQNMGEPLAARLDKFRKLLMEEKLDCFLIAVPENRYYLSGFEAEDMNLVESSGYLLITESKQFLLTDFRYQEEAKQEAPDFEAVIYKEGLTQALPDLFLGLQVERLGVEGDYLTHKRYKEVEEAFKKAVPKGDITAVGGLVERLRIVKEPAEITAIKASLALTERTLSTLWSMLEPGLKEKDLAWKIEILVREGGGEGVSFPPIVASGPNAALPHAVPTDRRIAPGDSVILDLGSRLQHYCSDMTRTWTAGVPDRKVQEIYRIVREAQLAAQDCIKPGASGGEIDKVAREAIEKAGYGEYFGHGLGHGVGLAVHEQPRLRKQGEDILEKNMVITVEPGIYLPGIGGVRLENMVRVTSSGCEVLNDQDLFYPWKN
jgi:Xaa-Pro aminopeptidase